MKEKNIEIKNKIIKVINIIAYISLGLMLLLGVLVGVNSCKSNGNKNNKPPLETYERIDTNKDFLYGGNDIFGLNYDIQFYNFEADVFSVNGYFQEIYHTLIDFSQINSNKGNFDLGIQYENENKGVISYVYLERVNNIEITTDGRSQITYQDNTLYTLNLSLNDLYYIRFQVKPLLKLIYNDNFFIYCSYTSMFQNGSYLGHSLIYYMPIYQVIDINTEPYNINLSFQLAQNSSKRYYNIEYNRGNLYFKYLDKSTNTLENIALKPTLSKNGKKYIFKLTDLYGVNLPIDKNELFNRVRFETFAFGVCGYEYINSNYIYSLSNIIEGEMYFSPNMAYDYLLEYANFENNAIITNQIEGYFIIGGAYYTTLRATLETNINSQAFNFRLVALNGNNETITIFNGYKNNDAYGWNTDTLVSNSEFYYIRYTDVSYNENAMWAFYNYLFVDTYESGIIGGNTTYIGDTFVLIGSSLSALTSILGISLLPGLTIGMLFFVPFIVTIVLFVIWLFKR